MPSEKIHSETLVSNIKRSHNLRELKSYLFDASVCQASIDGQLFRDTNAREKLMSVYAILDALDNYEENKKHE